jgi:hypothetical protein
MDGHYKKKLLEFMKEKNKIVKKYTNLMVFTVREFAEVRDLWSEKDCRNAIEQLMAGADHQCCPWCLVRACRNCLYGKRNGICNTSKGNRYERILARIKVYRNIVRLPGMRDLVIKYSEA